MSHPVILVDFENVQKVDLARIPEEAHVRIFVGASQSRVPMELVLQAQRLGSRLDWVRIDGQGSNALDFHIAFYLGEYVARSPGNTYVILSRDKGFDPLIRHMAAHGHECRRVASLDELVRQQVGGRAAQSSGGGRSQPPAGGRAQQPARQPASQRAAQPRQSPAKASQPPRSQADDPRMSRVLQLLGKLEKKERPRRRKTLETQVASYFRNENALSGEALGALVQRLFDEKLITESNRALTYHF